MNRIADFGAENLTIKMSKGPFSKTAGLSQSRSANYDSINSKVYGMKH